MNTGGESVIMMNTFRKKEIIEYLSNADYRTLKDISKAFNISMNTARKDINELADEHLVDKFYGGVSLAKKKDSTFQSRIDAHLEEKRRIAQFAATLINENDLIFIDSGSTTSLLTDYLKKNCHYTILTNNIYVIMNIASNKNWDLIVVGTNLKHSSYSLVNVYNWDYLNSLNVNKAFLATTGLTIQNGATNPNNAETVIKTRMMKRSQENYLLTDFTKFDQTSFRTFANIDAFNSIITSGTVPKYYYEFCSTIKTQLIVV